MKSKFIRLAALVALWFALPMALGSMPPAYKVFITDAAVSALGIVFMRDSFRAVPKVRTMILCTLMCAVLLLGEGIVTGMLFRHFGLVQTTNDAHLAQVAHTGQMAFLVAGCILAPITEEIIFRGYIFDMLREICMRKHISSTPAYILSAALFAVMHSPANWVMAVPYFLSGLIFAIAYDHGSIHCSILAHVINNSLALL